jgi:hypothetical protein
MGHQMRNWDWNFIKLGHKLVFPPFLVVYWVSSPLSFFLSASTAARYIFTAPTCTTTIIILELCALNAEFQHFILRFNKKFLLCEYHCKRGLMGERECDFTDSFSTTIFLSSPVSFPQRGLKNSKFKLYVGLFESFHNLRLAQVLLSSFFLSLNLTSIPGPERSIWRQLHSWLEQNTPVV